MLPKPVIFPCYFYQQITQHMKIIPTRCPAGKSNNDARVFCAFIRMICCRKHFPHHTYFVLSLEYCGSYDLHLLPVTSRFAGKCHKLTLHGANLLTVRFNSLANHSISLACNYSNGRINRNNILCGAKLVFYGSKLF